MAAPVSVLQKQPCPVDHENFQRNPLLLGKLFQFLSQFRRNSQFNIHALNRIGV